MNVKKNATIFTAVLLFSIFVPAFTALSSVYIERPAAHSALLIETESGTILHETNSDERHPADALARIMTLLLAAEAIESGYHYPDELVGGGDVSLRDLMHNAFVGGETEAAEMIAYAIGGNNDFVRLMNTRAREIGVTGTTFTNAHGDHDPGQYTTAYDQYLIFRAAMSFPHFAEIAGSAGASPMQNPGSVYHFIYSVAGTTSISYEGGYSFVGMAEQGGLELISVVLGSDIIALADGAFLMRNLSEAQRLFEWGFGNFSHRIILSPNEPIARAPVVNGAGADYVNMRAESYVQRVLHNSISYDDFERVISIHNVRAGERLYAPVSAGDVLGEIRLMRGNEYYGTVRLVAITNIDLHRFEFFRMQLLEVLGSTPARITLAVLIPICAGYAALVIRYNLKRRERLRNIEAKKKELLAQHKRGQRDHDERVQRDELIREMRQQQQRRR